MPEGPSGKSVVVVGLGPAGLAATRALLEQGASVTAINEDVGSGGQYYKQYVAAPRVSRGSELDALHGHGRRKAAILASDRLTVHNNALVWGLFADNQIAVLVDGRVELLSPDAIVLATGAIEQVAAFPGWTLPGVMTAGGAQTILSREAILPGKRFLLAGTGPLLLAIALELAEAGGEVVAVVEGSGFADPARHIARVLGQPKRMRQFFEYRRTLRAHNIPVMHRHTVVAARGNGHVSEVSIAKVDAAWRVIPDTATTHTVDTLCLHYGFAASPELARLAGCDMAFDLQRGGWYVVHDEGMRATQPGIYVAGQPAGIGGADLAEATGRLAGLSVAKDLGFIDDKEYETSVRRARVASRRGRSFASMLNLVYVPGPHLVDIIGPEVVVCRCEEVTRAEVDLAIKRGARSLNDVKRQTRCGMGYCQGRVCGQILSPYLQAKAGLGPTEVGSFNVRPPVKPISLGALAQMPDPESATAETMVGHDPG